MLGRDGDLIADVGYHKKLTSEKGYKGGLHNLDVFAKVASAQLDLPVLSTLSLSSCLSYYNYYVSDYVTLDATTRLGLVAQYVYIVTTSGGAMCAAYATAFFVLEAYYLQLTVSADQLNAELMEGAEREQYELTRARLEAEVQDRWIKFTSHRNAAKNCIWCCLTSLFVSAMCELYAPDNHNNWLAFCCFCALFSGVVSIWKLVFEFRMRYIPIIEKHQGADNDEDGFHED